MDQIKLYQMLMDNFNSNELQQLCFDLGVDYETLAGTSKDAKTRELITFFIRHGRSNDLLQYLGHARPNVDWSGFELGASTHVSSTYVSREGSPRKRLPGRKWTALIVVTFVVVLAMIVWAFQHNTSQTNQNIANVGGTRTPQGILTPPSSKKNEERLSSPLVGAVSTQGITGASAASGIGLGSIYRAMSGNTETYAIEGQIVTVITSWLIYYKQSDKCYAINVVKPLPSNASNTGSSRSGTVLDPQTNKPLTSPSVQDCSITEDIWRNGSIDPIEYDFNDAVSIVYDEGYKITREMYGDWAYLLQKIRVNRVLKVVWRLPLQKNGKVEGLGFVDANTGEIYMEYLDRSRQVVVIDQEP